MSKIITYKCPNAKAKKYPAHNCIFAAQGYQDEQIQTFMDGDFGAIIKMMTALFQALKNQSSDAAFYYLEACMKILSESVGLTPDDIKKEIEISEEPIDDPEIK